MNITAKFNLFQTVRMKPLDCQGRIVAIQMSGPMIEYKLRYFNNGDEKIIWFYEDELG